MKLAEAKDASRGVGSFSRLREKAGDEGGLRYADLEPCLAPNPLPQAGEGARFMGRGWREAPCAAPAAWKTERE